MPEALTCAVKDKTELQLICLPFMKEGALFIPTAQSFQLGNTVTVELSILGEPPIMLTGQVVWITPVGAQNQMPAGIGVTLGDTDTAEMLRKKIETHLPTAFKAGRQTHAI